MMARLSKDAIDQARIALDNFRNLQPTLSAYARMLTGRPDIVVEASSTTNGKTDGKKIYYRPPISLGKKLEHQRWACDRRDEFKIMRCPACAQREDVLVTMYHEIAHIWFDSFKGVSEADKVRAIREAVNELGTKYGDAIQKRLDTKGYLGSIGYMGLAHLISPFLPTLLNSLEDARVNSALFHAMPGLQVMFDANTAEIFRNGVEQPGKEGEWTRELWSERPLNMQALIGLFCMASGYDFSEWLCEFVVKSLADDKLVALVKEMDEIDSVDSVFRLSFPILARLRELGFCRNEEDPEDDFEPPYVEEPDESEEKDDDGESEGDGDGEPGDETAGSGDDPESADDGGSGDESGSSDDRDAGDPEEGDEVDDSSDEGTGTPEAETGTEGSASADAEPADDGSGDGDDLDESSDGSGADDDSLGEADRGTASDSAAEPADGFGGSGAGGVRDDDEGDDALDAVPGEDSGDEGEREPGDGAESDADGDGEASDEPGLLDTGEFTKGTRVDGELPEPLVKPDLDWGLPEEVEIVVAELGEHEPPDSVDIGEHEHDGHTHTHSDEDTKGDEAVKAVLMQGMWFEMPSQHIGTVNLITDSDPYWGRYLRYPEHTKRAYGIMPHEEYCPDGTFLPPERIVGPAVMRGRIVFAANQRGKHERGQKRGRVHGASLAGRAPFNDPRMFEKKTLPGRVDYFVGLGVDISGSTTGVNLTLAKQVALAEAEVLNRLGIPFFLYAHSGSDYSHTGKLDVNIFICKHPEDPWNEITRRRVCDLSPDQANLDGHTMEFYRKVMERQRASKKIMHYYSDGAMPAENRNEELGILRREIQAFKRLGIVLAGVGIRSDAPRQHGLETVRVDKQEDVIKVIDDLEKRLLQR